MNIVKPKIRDIEAIKEILSQWTYQEEVNKYASRIKDEINGISQLGMRFWVIKDENKVVGIAGLADILPKIKKFSKTKQSCEIKILYLDQNQRGKGYGKSFLEFLENQAKKIGNTEILVQSGVCYQDTAWGFYEKHGYEKCGKIDDDTAVFRKII